MPKPTTPTKPVATPTAPGEFTPTSPITDIPNHLPRSPANPDPTPAARGPGIRDIYMPVTQLNRNVPKFATEISAHLAGANTSLGIVFGRARVPGLPVIIGQNTAGTRWTFLYVFCLGPVEAVEMLVIDQRAVDTSAQSGGAAFVHPTLWPGTQGQIFEGTPSQDVSTFMQSRLSDGYVDALPGICCVAFQLTPQSVTGLPRVEAIVKGINAIEDTRTATTGYTNNPALCLSHFIQTYLGKAIDNDSAEASADWCDEAMPDGKPRWTFNVHINQLLPLPQHVQWMENACQCIVWEEGDTVYLIPDAPAAKVIDIGPRHILGESLRWRRIGKRNRPDDVKVAWFDVDAGTIKEAEAIGSTAGELANIRAPWIDNYAEAHRFAIQRYNHRNIEDLDLAFRCADIGIRLQRGDVIAVTSPLNGIHDKHCRVTGVAQPEPGVWEIQAREYQPNAYDESVQSDPILADTNLPDPYDVPVVEKIVASGSRQLTSDGSEVIAANVSWDEVSWLFVAGYQIRIYNTDNVPPTLDAAVTAAFDETTALVPGLLGNTHYEARVRTQSKVGSYGAEGIGAFITPQDSIAPGVVSGVRSEITNLLPGDVALILISWQEPTDTDIAHYDVQISDALDIGEPPGDWDVPIHRSGSTSYLWPSIFNDGSREYRWRVRALDRSGNAGDWTETPSALSWP